MRRLAILCFSLLGCRSAQSGASSPAAPAAALALAECSVSPVEDGGAAWREVRTPSFTFCVPSNWTSRDPRSGRSWRGEGVDLRWSPSARQEMTITRERVVAIPHGLLGIETQRTIDETRRELRELDETIDGRLAHLVYNHVKQTYYASALWESPELQFTATAINAHGAARAMQIFRTVRFVAAGSASGPAGH